MVQRGRTILFPGAMEFRPDSRPVPRWFPERGKLSASSPGSLSFSHPTAPFPGVARPGRGRSFARERICGEGFPVSSRRGEDGLFKKTMQSGGRLCYNRGGRIPAAKGPSHGESEASDGLRKEEKNEG